MKLILGKMFDLKTFRPVGRFVGIIVRFILPGLAEKILLPQVWRDHASVFVRGSLTALADFNPLFSDWDLGIVVDDEIVDRKEFERECQAILVRRRKIRRLLPSVGEFEIYSASEKKVLDELMHRYSRLYQDFRNLRKTRWIEKEAAAPETNEYQSFKSRRGLETCYKRLGYTKLEAEVLVSETMGWPHAIERVLEKFANALPTTIWPTEFGHEVSPFYHAFLDRDLPSSLGPRSISLLFALAPSIAVPTQLQDAVNLWRRDSQVREACEALSRIEAIIVRAVTRTMSPVPEEYRSWLRTLEVCSNPPSEN